MSKKQSIFSLLLSFLLVGAGSGLSALLTREGMKNYETIAKPLLSPPGIVFPIVWSILFALMAISAWMVLIALAQSYSIKGGAVLRSDAALFCAACCQLFLAGVFLPVWLAAVRADLADFADRAGLADGPRLLAGAACGGGFADSLSGVAAVCSLPERRGLGAQLGKKEDRLPLTDGRIIVFVKIILRGT